MPRGARFSPSRRPRDCEQDGYITDNLMNRLEELLAAQKANDDAAGARADAGPLWIVGIDPDGTTVRGVKRGSIADEFLAAEGR